MCVFWCGIRLHRGPVWCSDTTCSVEKGQQYQPKPVAVETVDPKRTRLKSQLRKALYVEGQGKFEGETLKKQNVAARLSSVLGIPVVKNKIHPRG